MSASPLQTLADSDDDSLFHAGGGADPYGSSSAGMHAYGSETNANNASPSADEYDDDEFLEHERQLEEADNLSNWRAHGGDQDAQRDGDPAELLRVASATVSTSSSKLPTQQPEVESASDSSHTSDNNRSSRRDSTRSEIHSRREAAALDSSGSSSHSASRYVNSAPAATAAPASAAQNAAAAQADALVSPQPVRSAPRPHQQQSEVRLDAQFDRSQWNESLSHSSRAAPSAASSFAAAAAARPLSQSVSASQARAYSSGAAQPHPALIASSVPALGSLDTPLARRRWLEHKHFILSRLGAALKNKVAEVCSRARAVHEDQPACEQKLLATLHAFVRRTQRTLDEYVEQIDMLQTQVDASSQRVQQELARCGDDSATRRHDDSQPFELVSREVEEQLQDILTAVAARDNFKLDGPGGAAGTSTASSSALPSFDPFNAARVRELEEQNARLQARVEELQLAAPQAVALPSSASPSVAAAASSGGQVVVSLHETQGIILTLQSQVESVSRAHALLVSEHERLQTECSTLRSTLKHERSTLNGQATHALDRVAQLEESLRTEQAQTQKLQTLLDRRSHDLAQVTSALSAEQASHAATALAAQVRDSARNDEVASLRRAAAESHTQSGAEAASLHRRIESMQVEHAAALRRVADQGEKGSAQALAELAVAFEEEKRSWTTRMEQARQDSERTRRTVENDAATQRTEWEQKIDELTQALSRTKTESTQSLANLQRLADARQAEVVALGAKLAQAEKDAASRAQKDASKLSALTRQNEADAKRLAELQRSLDASILEARAAQREVDQSSRGDANLRLEMDQLRAQLRHAQEQARDSARQFVALQAQHAELTLQRQEEQHAFSQSSLVLSSQAAKISTLELSLELAEKRCAEMALAADTAASQSLTRESELARRLKAAEADHASAVANWDATHTRLEMQLVSAQTALAAQKALAAASQEAHDRDLIKFTALQSEAQSAAANQAARLSAQVDAQVELVLARFISTHGARVQGMLHTVAAQWDAASAVGMWEGAGAESVQEVAAVSALRQAVLPSQPSSVDPMHAYPSLASSAAPLSAAVSKQHFESSLAQLESQLTSLVHRAQSGRRKAGERFQAVIMQLRTQAREQLQKSEHDAASKLAQVHAAHEAGCAAMRAEFETHQELVRVSHDEQVASLTAQASEAAAQAAEALSACNSAWETRVQEELSACEAHYSSLLDAARSEAQRNAETAAQDIASLRALVDQLETDKRESDAAWTTKLASSEQESQSRLAALQEERESHRVALRLQGENHAQALQDSLQLYERKARLELMLAKEESRGALERLERESRMEREVMERQQKDALDAMELRYVAQLEQMQREHETSAAALDELHRSQVSARGESHAQEISQLQRQHEDALAVARQLSHAQLAEQQAEHDALVAQLRANHSAEMDRVWSANLDTVRNLLRQGLVRIDVGMQGTGDDGEEDNELHDGDAFLTHRSGRTDESSSSSALSTPTALARAHRSVSHAGTPDSQSTPATATAVSAAAPERRNAHLSPEAELASLQTRFLQATRACKTKVRELQSALAESHRERARAVAQAEERADAECSRLREEITAMSSALDAAQQQVQVHRSHAESLQERWRSLSATHELLQTRQTQLVEENDKLRSELREHADKYSALQRKLTDATQALQRAVDESASSRSELLAAHAAERRRFESLLLTRGEEALLAQQHALAEAEAAHARTLAARVRELESEATNRAQKVTEQFESLVRARDARIAQQLVAISALESRVTSFTERQAGMQAAAELRQAVAASSTLAAAAGGSQASSATVADASSSGLGHPRAEISPESLAAKYVQRAALLRQQQQSSVNGTVVAHASLRTAVPSADEVENTPAADAAQQVPPRRGSISRQEGSLTLRYLAPTTADAAASASPAGAETTPVPMTRTPLATLSQVRSSSRFSALATPASASAKHAGAMLTPSSTASPNLSVASSPATTAQSELDRYLSQH